VVASALTDAELRVLALLPTHLTAPQIAVELFVAQSTVRSQITSIYRKLGARSRAEAVRRARELGLL
jgi:LuxR family maltose regulon positive regulatory protein